ncbi:MAG: hypothetical protein C4334_15020 [Pyrinomonas sp.]
MPESGQKFGLLRIIIGDWRKKFPGDSRGACFAGILEKSAVWGDACDQAGAAEERTRERR